MAALDEADIVDDTIVVLTADHGEYLGEHGYVGHHELYDPVLHVPLVLHVPSTAGQRVSSFTSTIDVVPTLVRLLGLPPLPGAQGTDLLAGEKSGPQPVFAEWRDFGILDPVKPSKPWDFAFAAQVGTKKYMRSMADPGVTAMFDLAVDPTEEWDLLKTRPHLAKELEAELKRHIEADLPGGVLGIDDVVIDAENREMLRALGYLE